MKGQIKVSNVIMMVILAVGILVGASMIVSDFQRSYVETGVISPNETFEEEDLAQHRPSIDKLNETLNPLQRSFDKIANEEGFLKITGILEVFPVILITGIKLMPTFFTIINESLYSALGKVVPKEIITIFLLSLTVWMFFQAINLMRRYPA